MPRVYDLFIQGDPVMWPLLGLSVVTMTCALEQTWFWFPLLRQEDRIVLKVLDSARYDILEAAAIAQAYQHLPIGRFLLAPLSLALLKADRKLSYEQVVNLLSKMQYLGGDRISLAINKSQQ